MPQGQVGKYYPSEDVVAKKGPTPVRNAPKVSCYCHSLTYSLIHSLTLSLVLRCVPPLSPVLCLSFSEEDYVERELCA